MRACSNWWHWYYCIQYSTIQYWLMTLQENKTKKCCIIYIIIYLFYIIIYPVPSYRSTLFSIYLPSLNIFYSRGKSLNYKIICQYISSNLELINWFQFFYSKVTKNRGLHYRFRESLWPSFHIKHPSPLLLVFQS